MIRQENISAPATNSVSGVTNAVDEFQNKFSDALTPEEFFKKYGNKMDAFWGPDLTTGILGNLFTFGQYGRAGQDMWQKQYDFNLQKYFKDYDTYLANTEIQRRVKDALAAGINPVFALDQRGAGDTSGALAHNSSSDNKSGANSLLKMLMVLFGLVKFLA